MEKDFETYVSGTGQKLYVHNKNACKGFHCPIHNSSNHKMKDWPTNYREDRGLMERICEHGVGHPDPDDLNFKERTRGKKYAELESIHGCDGCCSGAYKK